MPNFLVKYLVEKKEVWKNIIPHQKVYTNEKWVKIIIYTVLIKLFSTDDGLYLLEQKIFTNIRPPYNPSQLAEHPIEHTHD